MSTRIACFIDEQEWPVVAFSGVDRLCRSMEGRLWFERSVNAVAGQWLGRSARVVMTSADGYQHQYAGIVEQVSSEAGNSHPQIVVKSRLAQLAGRQHSRIFVDTDLAELLNGLAKEPATSQISCAGTCVNHCRYCRNVSREWKTIISSFSDWCAAMA